MKKQVDWDIVVIFGALFICVSVLLSGCSTPERKPAEPLPPLPTVETVDVLYTKSNLEWLKDAVKKANCVINLPAFQLEVSKVPSFDYSDDNGKQVIDKLLKKHVLVLAYRSKNPWSKAIAYAGKDVNLNSRKHPRAMPSMVNTLVHEPLHIVGYSHGNNSSVGKENSVNYKVGKMAEKYLAFCP